MDAKEMNDRKDEYMQSVRQQLTPINILVYSLIAFGMFGLGLLNWATLTFNIEQLTIAYLIHFGLQVVSYASIIMATSTKQLHEKKKLSEELYKLLDYVRWVLDYYRPEKLQDYIYQTNLKWRKDAYLDKYRYLLEQLEKKNSDLDIQRTWRKFKKELDNAGEEEVEPPNDYCSNKQAYLDKIDNWEKYYLDEFVEYDKLDMDDLTIGIGKKGKKNVPRGKESYDLTLGVIQGLIIMIIGGLLTTVIVANFQDDTINGVIKTLIVIFFVILSAFKGLMNGERVFENTTMTKAKFRKHHLHSYVMFEATTNKYVFEEKDNST